MPEALSATDPVAPKAEDTAPDAAAESTEGPAHVQGSVDACAQEQGKEASCTGLETKPEVTAADTSPDVAAQAPSADVKLEPEVATPGVEDILAAEAAGQQAAESGDVQAPQPGT